MWQAQEFVRRIGKVLHTKDDDITPEPLPERWVDLIRYLDQKERQASEAFHIGVGVLSLSDVSREPPLKSLRRARLQQ